MIWLDANPPLSPLRLKASHTSNGVRLSWNAPLPVRDGKTAYGYVIYCFEKKERIDINNPRNIIHITFDNKQTSFTDLRDNKPDKYVYLVTALDRMKNESTPSNKVTVKIK